MQLVKMLGMFLLPIILTTFVLGLIGFTIYMVLGGAGRLMDRLRDEVGPQFLRETVPTLLPWELSQALPDMSSLCRSRRSGSGLGGGRSHCRGTMHSLSNHGKAWLAYVVNTHRRYGTVELYTSKNRLLVDVRGDPSRRGYRVADITVDRDRLGSVRLEDGELYDAAGRPLGCMRGGRIMLMQGMVNYRTVDLRGRAIAEINTEPLGPLDRPGPMPPAFRMHLPEQSVDEQWWLVGLLAIALYSDCITSDV